MALKPQDVVVALKLLSYREGRPPISVIAHQLGLSPSEVHAATKRLQASRLLHGPEMQQRVNIAAFEEFLLHGLKYAFPAEHTEITRGVPTSLAAEPLRRQIAADEDPLPVWPWFEGTTRGAGLKPLYKTVPRIALRDPQLYEYLSLVDAIRSGRARERQLAEKALVKRLRSAYAKS
jgi:DNA-binding Lrp family transcriptional regulator